MTDENIARTSNPDLAEIPVPTWRSVKGKWIFSFGGKDNLTELEAQYAFSSALRLQNNLLRAELSKRPADETSAPHRCRAMDLAGELRRYFDSGTLDEASDLYLLLKEVEAMRPVEPKSTQTPDSRGDAALWVLAWLAMKGGLGSDVHEVIEAVMEGRAEMRPNNKLHIEPRGAENGTREL